MAEKDNNTEMPDADDLTGLTDDERRKRGRAPDPVLPGMVAPKASPPRPVAISFWFWVGGGVSLILGYVELLLDKANIVDLYVQNTHDPRFTPDQIATGVVRLLWFLFVASIVFSLLFALFAYKAREGTRSARTVLTILPVVLLLLIMVTMPVLKPLTILGILLFVAALILLYLPSVAGYFPKAGRKK